MDRETFTIDHKVAWLDSEDPITAFFDLENVAFSHMKCNFAEGRKNRKYATAEEKVAARRQKDRERKKRSYSTEQRRAKFRMKGY